MTRQAYVGTRPRIAYLAALSAALVFGFILSREIGGRIAQLREEVQILQTIIDQTQREREFLFVHGQDWRDHVSHLRLMRMNQARIGERPFHRELEIELADAP